MITHTSKDTRIVNELLSTLQAITNSPIHDARKKMLAKSIIDWIEAERANQEEKLCQKK